MEYKASCYCALTLYVHKNQKVANHNTNTSYQKLNF